MSTVTPPRLQAARTRPCPGGCGRAVELHRYACVHCWIRLPAVLRAPIRENYRRDWDAHAAAVADGDTWFRDHPLPVDGDPAAAVPAQPTPASAPGPGQTALFDIPRRPVPTSDQLR
ncbi:MAG TPA: hypothetical protein VJ914_40330, partial [Pseudonocardiaceae bacterium]|nr:hypothetical protein [Pseudonocardiaceae bacterium]